jgi:hypothetical protein
MLKSLAIAAALALVGCGGRLAPPSHFVVRMTDPYPWSSYFDGMVEAAAKWQAATGLRIDVEVSSAPCAYPGEVCVSGRPVPWCTPEKCDAEGRIGGATTLHPDWTSDIWLADGLTDAQIAELAEHELGHALGLKHEPGDNVMNPEPADGWGITETNLRDWRAIFTAP